MFKNKAVVIIILIVLIVSAFVLKTSLFPTTWTVERNLDKITGGGEAITMDTILNDVRGIVKWESDQYSRATILWNTEEEELKLEGIGYLFGDEMGSKVLYEKHDTLKVYLRDYGFEHDMYNVGNNAPGYERSILKFNDIGCELYIRDVEMKGGTDMGFLCTKLPKEVTAVEVVPMSEKRARSIAETGECVVDGTLKDNALYNDTSKTWWIDLDIDKSGCNPACVIYEDESVEINWRCTGAIPE